MAAPPQFLRVNGFTRADRNQTIAALRDAIAEGGGWITDFKYFSNLSICINFEISPRHVGRLRRSLEATAVRLTEESVRALAALADAPPSRDEEDAEIIGTLQVTFIHNEPDLRIEVPPIPG
jgi:hypothetical protein